MDKLNKVLAVERAVKSGTYARVTELHKLTQKPGSMDGFEKTYRPAKEDDTRKFPPESKKVEYNAKEVFEEVSKSMTEIFDITLAKDVANCNAKADVVVDGQTILKDVPATYLLYLDKQLGDLRTFIDKMNELDPAVQWNTDPQTGLYRSDAIETIKTEKVQEALVLHAPTVQHPAQTQLITKDVVTGFWTTIKYSGAIARTDKKKLLARVQKLINAVKGALEQANMTDAPTQSAGDPIFGYIFGT